MTGCMLQIVSSRRFTGFPPYLENLDNLEFWHLLFQISYRDFFLGFHLYLGINPFLPLSGYTWTCQLTWSVTMLTCIQTCNITIVICGYASSLTNHITWHKYQWFITMTTYWSHCDIIEMHVRFVSPLSISFVKSSTQITSDLCSKVNITKYRLIYWQFTSEEITAAIETRRACLWLIFCLSFCIYRHI